MLIVFVVGTDWTVNRAGCIIMGVLLHYFILVTWMWMAVEALLYFQIMSIVFMKASEKYFVIVSVICWGESLYVTVIYTSIINLHNIGAPVIPVAVIPDNYITPPNNTSGALG